MLNNGLFLSEKDDWETPKALFDRLDAEFHFTLDPCCTVKTAKCATYYTPEIDGLKMPWYGSVFVNPPYGRGIVSWMRKAKEAAASGAVVVCLVPCRTDTKWWHETCMHADEIRLLTRRLTFEGAGNKATFPAAIVVFRNSSGKPKLMAFDV